MKKKLLAGIISAALLLTACGADKENNKTGDVNEIIFGGLGPLTGEVSVYGISTHNGIKLAIEEINEAGGIMGKKIVYKLEDEKGDQQEAVHAYNKLVDEGIHVLIGDVTSGPSLTVSEIAKETKIPMVTPTGTQLNITQGKENVFRTCFTDPYQGVVLAKFAKENLKAKTVAVMSNTSSDYSKGVAQSFIEKAKEYGLEVVANESYQQGDTDYSAQLTNIAGKNPDIFLIPDYYETLSLIVKQGKAAGIKATYLGGDGWDGIISQLKGGDESAVEGAYFANHYSVADQNSTVKNFVENYKKTYNEAPTAFSALGYDTVYMLKKAIEHAGTVEKEALTKAIKNIEFDKAVTGAFTFDENNNPIKAVTMTKIVDGKYTLSEVVRAK